MIMLAIACSKIVDERFQASTEKNKQRFQPNLVQLQRNPLNIITFGPYIFDYIKRLIVISEVF